MRRALLMITLFALGACTDRTDAPYVKDVPESTTKTSVLTITARDRNGAGNFTSARAEAPRYFNNTISIPPIHKAGDIELSYREPDPEKVFVIADQKPLSGAAGFTHELRSALTQKTKVNREVVIYVHGYNSSYTDGVFRAAQLQNDLSVPGVMVNYSWPSAANPLGYSHDRDSVLFARDGFQDALELIRDSTDAPILLVAHSMGAFLVMEGLRQIEIANPGWSEKALSGVVLVAPDISLDVFRQQASRFDTLPQPFAIFTSQKDPALKLSARVNAVDARLGNLADPLELADLPVTLIDVTQFSARGVDRHFVPGTSPALIALLRRSLEIETAFRSDASGRSGLIPGAAISVRKATQLVLSPGLVRAN
ncbi:alpha/beta hydrolase [Planktotalea arctica]|uniref:alpha/beta hydrolase n=1 Tax=Planktotalea arctica TaxID=1481893 RepID=UPI000A1759FB|nr:alpha/beta fold hydrolase [Planktotalea arctica]